MPMKYISDTHLYDVYSLGWRPEQTLEQFAQSFIDTYNFFVQPEDCVIWVGDIGYCCDKTKTLIRGLNGKKILVLGNHDSTWGNAVFDASLFQGVYRELDMHGLHIEHIPSDNVRCNYFIHGHHHRYDLPGMHNALKLYTANSKMLNCSADLTKCRPMSLPELITNKELCIESYTTRGLIKED